MPFLCPAVVASFTGARIETFSARRTIGHVPVASFTGARIETCARLLSCVRLPSRVLHGRADRNSCSIVNSCIVHVASFTGARIETLRSRLYRRRPVVASFTGARIETAFSWVARLIRRRRVLHGRADRNIFYPEHEQQDRSRVLHGRADRNPHHQTNLHHNQVASFTGARIETSKPNRPHARPASRVLHGRADRNSYRHLPAKFHDGRVLHGRADRNLCLLTIDALQVRRVLHGRADRNCLISSFVISSDCRVLHGRADRNSTTDGLRIFVNGVASFTGARIETLLSDLATLRQVASFTGARIETYLVGERGPEMISRVLHGRADRNTTVAIAIKGTQRSRPSRARG